MKMCSIQCCVPNLSSVLLSICVGTGLTIFYKKNFRWERHVVPVRETVAALLRLFLIPITVISETSFPRRASQAFLTSARTAKEKICLPPEEKLKALVLSSCVLLPSVAPDCPQLFSRLAVGCATTQFLRWPVELKDFLRELRIICGPAYVLLVVEAAWAHFGRTPSSVLPIVAASLASFASVFLRPDNSELVQRLGLPIPSTSARKLSHGAFMFLSSVCITAHSLWFHNSTAVYWTVFGLGLANSLLYLAVADFPRKCLATITLRRF